MKFRLTHAIPLVVAVPLLAWAMPGGWAVITVDDLPERITAGQPVELAFMIRQHGMTPMEDLKPVVTARAGDRDVRAHAAPTGKPGHYAARLTMPREGDWRITIDSDFGDSRVTLLPIRAAAAGSRNGNGAPHVTPPWERGRQLFVAKGCVTCHVHRDIEGANAYPVGPDLTERRFAADYLAMYLADPSIRPPTGGNRMPDLGLSRAEITALVAFLNGDRAGR